MIGKTLYFSQAVYLSIRNELLVARFAEQDIPLEIQERLNSKNEITFSLSEVAYLVLDNPQITLTQAVFEHCMKENIAIVTCDSSHIPTGLCLALHSNVLQSERYREQIEASDALKKQLWAQIVKQKIINQGKVLCAWQPKYDIAYFQNLSRAVKNGDSSNCEAAAANFYWSRLFSQIPGFVRRREGIPPNNLLNYGYAILRAITARAIVATGLLPTLGLHHTNRYNPYCLADDMMEAYRPYVDHLVCQIINQFGIPEQLDKNIKARLLQIPYIDVHFRDEVSPLMNGVQKTIHSLYRCFVGEDRKLYLPEIEL
ncbi:MAG: type II CRISPR-associated endonuclease Cas1 [Bacteroidia bacterium]|nr:type II CRISPR-associated endonuclease Cas1 [Bacteroidia bacterium]MDW8303178.1 type II CRISPR-associated endonuclease Cas1 [Bacteroidia bacterium]